MTDAVAPAGFERWSHPSPVLERLGSFEGRIRPVRLGRRLGTGECAFTAGGRLVAVARGLFMPA